MSPRFLFSIDEICENPNRQSDVDRVGHWVPSTDSNANRRVTGGVSGRLWFCDTQTIVEAPQPCPPQAQRYKQFSVYFVAGLGFWILRGDATTPDPTENWLPLRFDHSPEDYSSFLTNAGQHRTLRLQRGDQNWPIMLLPDIYHSSICTHERTYGGLTGELPIFLALLAISMPREYLASMLPKLFAGGAWQVHSCRIPRTDQRGVVVTVYTCPSNWGGGSTATELDHYERGYLGKYYY